MTPELEARIAEKLRAWGVSPERTLTTATARAIGETHWSLQLASASEQSAAFRSDFAD
jgi:hypothetical protein